MYFYIIVSTFAFFYCSAKLMFDRTVNPEFIELIGVTRDGDNHVLGERPDEDEYDYFKMYYVFKKEKYCALSEDVPRVADIDFRTHDVARKVAGATLHINDMEVDMTELIRQVAGPRCDFHGALVDFNWLFPKCVGTLVVDFTDDVVEIDIESNTVKSGSRDIIPIVEYVNVDSDIELD